MNLQFPPAPVVLSHRLTKPAQLSTNCLLLENSWDTFQLLNHSVKINQNKRYSNTIPVIDEVHIRHLAVDEALVKLEKYLNDAFMAGLYHVRVVHGKGTGTLRQTVHEQLAKHPLVKSYRIGVYGEGEDGVTIVELAVK